MSGQATELRSPPRWMMSNRLGRIVFGSFAGFGRVDLFDRAMAIAAQLFTSAFPILLMVSVWVGQATSERLAEAVSLPPVSQDVLEPALDESGGTAIGVVGTLLVLASATNLSRALTRGMAVICRLLAGQVLVRRLIPGGVVFALAMVVVRPTSAAYLPGALEEGADRYGPIRAAFTYLGWLYFVSLIFLAASTIGNVIAEHQGQFG